MPICHPVGTKREGEDCGRCQKRCHDRLDLAVDITLPHLLYPVELAGLHPFRNADRASDNVGSLLSQSIESSSQIAVVPKTRVPANPGAGEPDGLVSIRKGCL